MSFYGKPRVQTRVNRPALDRYIADLIEQQTEPVFDLSPGMVFAGHVAGLIKLKTGKEVKVLAVAASLVRLGWVIPKNGQESIRFKVGKQRRTPKGLLLTFRSTVTPILNPEQLFMYQHPDTSAWNLNRIQAEVNGQYSETSEWWVLEGDPLDRL
jgi:hypothetical protein